MSQRIMNILSSMIPLIEIYSIDEAFLDLNQHSTTQIYNLCHIIRKKILQGTGIPVSIGVGRTKTLSKIANHISKRKQRYGGVFILNKKDEDLILNEISVSDIWGVGSKLGMFLPSLGINTAKQLKYTNLKFIRSKINIIGEKIVKELRGKSCFDIENLVPSKKSICTSRTFGNMVNDLNDLSSSIAMYATRCAEKLRLQHSYAYLAHVFITTNPFREKTNQYAQSKIIKFPVATNDTSEIIKAILFALEGIYKHGYEYKKAGVILSGIIQRGEVQENLFDSKNRFSNEIIMGTIDKINRKMGQDFVRYAALGYKKKWQLKQQQLSPCYTTRWSELLTINLNKICVDDIQ